jgi:DNA-3-methyladenine glycosylase
VIMLANGVSLALLSGILYLRRAGRSRRLQLNWSSIVRQKRARLEPAFFDRPADVVARDLLGRVLVRRVGGKAQALIISETEAYLGPHDLACHAARGRTARTEVMFGSPGTLYVYLVYGLHWMLNVVTGPQGYPAAVLIRAAGGLSGPGRLSRALDIAADFNGKLAHPRSGLWFEQGGSAARPITATPRIGVAYAGPLWSRRRLRFLLD